MPLSTLVSVAGRRSTVEESFQTAKGQTGLDQHQVRRGRSWYRWTTLVLLAHALLAITTAVAGTRPAPAPIAHILAWSTWRRRHQHRARQAHYQRQSTHEP